MTGKTRDYPKLAADILQELGGEKNIVKVSRCATRLRLVVKDNPPNAKENISKLAGVITVVDKGGQIQVVIGTNVGKVYDAFLQLVNPQTIAAAEDNNNILNKIIATMSAVFAPFVYILAASGILQGCLIIIKLFWPSFEQLGVCKVLSLISWAPFIFLPIFIAITASQHFRCNIYIAVACCAALLSPELAKMAELIKDGKLVVNFLGFNLPETTYASSVLPPLFLVWLLSYFERFLDKFLNNVIKPIFMPLLCLIIMVPLTLIVVGPLTANAAHYIAYGYNNLVDLSPSVAGSVIGGVWQILVIFGVHWGIIPVILANFEQYGFDSFQAYQMIAVIGQVGAAFGFYIKSKNKEMKGIALSAGITGIFGITEPAIYGVNLRFKKPFICGCLSSAIGCFVAGFFMPYYYAYAGLPGILTIVNAINPDHLDSIIGASIGSSIALFLPVILIQLLGTGEPKVEEKVQDDTPKILLDSVKIASPMTGKVLPLDQVPDPVFASKTMGDGIAIEPIDNHVYAPCDGEIKALFDSSKHAIGLLSDQGIEMLIHVGIDTVNLTDNQFTYHVTMGQKVKQGDLLSSFDIEAIKQAGYSLITPIIITNTDEYQQIIPTSKTDITPQDILLTVKQ